MSASFAPPCEVCGQGPCACFDVPSNTGRPGAGDDRPRPTDPKKLLRKKRERDNPPQSCAVCGYVYTQEVLQAGGRLRKRTLKLLDDTSEVDLVCFDDKACRQRELSAQIGRELGYPELQVQSWLWCKFPRETVREQMDVRPKGVAGWMPRWYLHERVRACILYHSWCYPVSRCYAVQIAHTCPMVGRDDPDPDAIVLDTAKHPVPLRVKDIARILNEQPGNEEYAKRAGSPNISRAIARLKATKEIRVDEDGVIYPCASILEMTLDERRDIWNLQVAAIDPALRSIPRSYRPVIEAINAVCPDEVSIQIFRGAMGYCEKFNDKLKSLRGERNVGIEDWLAAQIDEHCGAHISSDMFEQALRRCSGLKAKLKTVSSGIAEGVDQTCSAAPYLIPAFPSSATPRRPTLPTSAAPSPSPAQAQDGDGGEPLNQLYEAGMGKGAIAKLPPKPRTLPEPQASMLAEQRAHSVVAKAFNDANLPVDDEAVRELINLCRHRMADVTGEEIAHLVGELASQARHGKYPVAYLKASVPKHMTPSGRERLRDRMKEAAALRGMSTEKPNTGPDAGAIRGHILAAADRMAEAKVELSDLVGQLRAIAGNSEAYAGDLEALEQQLARIEDQMLRRAREGLTSEQRGLFLKAFEAYIRPYAKKLTADQRAQMERQHMDRAVVAEFGLPRMGLFYLRAGGAE